MHTFTLGSGLLVLLLQTSAAQSPPGFRPHVTDHLNVRYDDTNVAPAGTTVSTNDVQQPPQLKPVEGLQNKGIAILMDFSVQLPHESTNKTLLHWIQPGLLSSDGLLQSTVAPVAPYFPPGPPPGQTHTYGVFLYAQGVGEFEIPNQYQEYFANLTTSVNNRIGFSLNEFARAAHLGRPLAANFFLVSTASNTTNTTTSMQPPASSTVICAATDATSSVLPTTATATTSSDVNIPQQSNGASRLDILAGCVVSAAALCMAGR